MRGRCDPQTTMLAFVDLEERVPRNHPLRVVKQFADRALRELSPVFNEMYAAGVRPTHQHPQPTFAPASTDTTNAYASTCGPSFRSSASPHEQHRCRSLFVTLKPAANTVQLPLRLRPRVHVSRVGSVNGHRPIV